MDCQLFLTMPAIFCQCLFTHKVSRFLYESMDDMMTRHISHLIDFFHNSDFNAVVSDPSRYHAKTTPALLIAEQDEGIPVGRESIRKMFGISSPALPVAIPRRVSPFRVCAHLAYDKNSFPNLELCTYMYRNAQESFILGPLLLELP